MPTHNPSCPSACRGRRLLRGCVSAESWVSPADVAVRQASLAPGRRPGLATAELSWGYFFLRLLFFGGTFAPERRASERPMAIACLRLFTLRPERPLRSVPLLRSCIARLTLLWAFFPYRAMRIAPAPSAP